MRGIRDNFESRIYSYLRNQRGNLYVFWNLDLLYLKKLIFLNICVYRKLHIAKLTERVGMERASFEWASSHVSSAGRTSRT